MAQMSNEQWQEVVVALADISDEKARERELTKTAMQLGGNFTQVSQHLSNEVKAYLAQHQDAGPSLNVTQFNTPVGGLQVQGNAAFDQNGKLAGSGTSLQTGVMDNSYGAASVGVATALDAQGKLTTVSPYGKYVGPAFGTEASSPVAGVPIAAVTANIPINGNFEAKNVDMTAGVAAWHKKTGISSITTVTTDAAGSKAVVGQNFSGNVYSGDDVKVALNAGVSHDFVGSKTGVSGGVLVRGDVNEHVQLYAGANVVVNDIGRANDLGVGFQLGANFDFNEKSAPAAKADNATPPVMQDEVNAAAQSVYSSMTAHRHEPVTTNIQSVILTAQNHDGPNHMTNGLKSQLPHNDAQQSGMDDFLRLSHKEQVAVINNMTDNYVKHNPDVGREQAKEIVVHALLNPQRQQAAEMSHS